MAPFRTAKNNLPQVAPKNLLSPPSRPALSSASHSNAVSSSASHLSYVPSSTPTMSFATAPSPSWRRAGALGRRLGGRMAPPPFPFPTEAQIRHYAVWIGPRADSAVNPPGGAYPPSGKLPLERIRPRVTPSMSRHHMCEEGGGRADGRLLPKGAYWSFYTQNKQSNRSIQDCQTPSLSSQQIL